MKGLKEFKVSLKNNIEFKNEFLGVKNVEGAIQLAKKSGFDLNERDVKNDTELRSDLLDAVAGGGKTQKYQEVRTTTTVTGDNSGGTLKTIINQNL